jgi:eight-cysteine-cluster-containing protein
VYTSPEDLMHVLPSVLVRSLPVAAVLALVACGGNGKKDRSPDGERPIPVAAPAPLPVAPVAPVAAAETPAELYASCKDRMENPQAAGECKADADCAKAGCSMEVCTTAAQSKEINTICDSKPCFKVVDACGCHDGMCTWTLKSEVPPAAPALGNRLPPTPPGN